MISEAVHCAAFLLFARDRVPRPPAKAKALEFATRGYCWARGGADASQFWSAVRKTGVHVSPSEATLLLTAWQAPRLRMSNVETRA
ncbi:hypothetical protein [Paraburkholderia phenoliruptrix]|uniref:hypothetical protein n=1 Tax=Paraburkholderia phenoliruptrix TaxID=252970 RepID=UPI002869E80C|nr:hypothetical protein [Paraburkholderia phenoliruptrix]WMY08662.1 hypothetical protein P3F88_02470 [Paraburkholderia phenoliruptrix]